MPVSFSGKMKASGSSKGLLSLLTAKKAEGVFEMDILTDF